MLAYVILILILIFGIILSDVSKHKDKNIILLFIILFIVLLQGLRSFDVGIDIQSYRRMYYDTGFLSTKEILRFHEKEQLYFLTNKLFYFLKFDFRIMLFFSSFVMYGSLGYISYKYSKNPIMSVFIFITLGLFVFSLSGLRQTIAMGITLFSFNFIKEKKLFKYLVITVIATMFHESAIFTIPIYFLYNAKKRPNLTLLSLPVLILAYILRQDITTFITQLYNPSHSIIETGAINMMILLIFIYLVSIYVGIVTKNDNIIRLQRILFIAILIQIMATYSQLVSRLGYYYYSYLILLIPELFSLIKEKEYKVISQTIFVIIFTFIFFNNILSNPLDTYPYKFLTSVNNYFILSNKKHMTLSFLKYR